MTECSDSMFKDKACRGQGGLRLIFLV